MLIAQISDLHVTVEGALVVGKVDSQATIAAAVDRLNALDPRPDLVVITGDLVNGPKPGEYEALARLMEPLTLPWCAIPGNHDDRAGLREFCAGQPWLPPDGPFFQYTIDHLPVRIIALDTQAPGEVPGVLCDQRLDWLADRLAEAPGRPTVLLMHHPPYEIGIGFMDKLRCFGRVERLAELVERHPAIERILCGHVHRQTCVRWHGTLASTVPAISFQFALQLDPEAKGLWTPEPPGIALHLWRDGVGMVSHIQPIGDYPWIAAR
jgi:3',5'-cyclic AMP phosphodiesterase CpdA